MPAVLDADLTADDVAELGDSPGPAPESQDVVSLAVGSAGYVQEHVVEGCSETFVDLDAWREPDTFDRFYWRPQDAGYTGPAPLLVDVLMTDTASQQADEREDKHCEFKAKWCAENDRAYVVLVDAECTDPRSVLEAIRAQLGHVEPATDAQEPARRGPGRPRKVPQGPAIQRPRDD